MSDSNPIPGKSLESDLRLIREANGLSREDIFNRVHIRPEVLAQVEEHGFGATPTLNSDIHRRSFVKHYADAVGIDSELALQSLEMSVNGIYNGLLAVEYLDLEELNPVPRWASAETSAEERTAEPETGDGLAGVHAAEPESDVSSPDESPPEPSESDGPESDESESDIPDFELPRAIQTPVFPVPEPDEHDEPELKDEGLGSSEAEAQDDATSVEPQQERPPTPVTPISEAAGPPASDRSKPSEPSDPPEAAKSSDEGVDAPGVEPMSPYAPPIGGRPVAATNEYKSPPEPPSATEPPPEPRPPAQPEPQGPRRRRETPTIPSSTMKESHIGPLEEEDFGDEEVSILTRMRTRHALAWIGLIGVGIIILLFVARAIYLNVEQQEEGARRIGSVEQLPEQFSGIVRLTPTTERFVTLQITPDSSSTTEFEYKMWTHNAGSTFAETGVGSLNTSNNQILLGEPYGIGGLFVLENGRYRLRSVRRVRFPRWEFTGHATP